jgi:hypothetical protein
MYFSVKCVPPSPGSISCGSNAEVGNFISKRNGVTHYRLCNVLRVVTFSSDNGSNLDRAINLRHDNGFCLPRVITFINNNFAMLL